MTTRFQTCLRFIPRAHGQSARQRISIEYQMLDKAISGTGFITDNIFLEICLKIFIITLYSLAFNFLGKKISVIINAYDYIFSEIGDNYDMSKNIFLEVLLFWLFNVKGIPAGFYN